MAHSQRSTFQHSDEFWSPGIQAGFALMGAVTLLLIAAICWAQREEGDNLEDWEPEPRFKKPATRALPTPQTKKDA
jgi:hypothetical protein